MSELVVTATGTDASGRAVTGTATAVLLDDTLEVRVDVSRLLAFTELVEWHVAAFRRDLERFTAGEQPDFDWFRREAR